MIEAFLLLIFSFLLGFGCLGVAGWLVISHQFASMDGLFMIMTALVAALVFLLNLAWTLRSQELADWIDKRLARKHETSPKKPAESTSPEKINPA